MEPEEEEPLIDRRPKSYRRQRSFSLPNNNNNNNNNTRNSVKLKQVLDYNHTEEKLAKILGVDAPTVREVTSAQHEGQLQRKRTLGATSQNKRNSGKALVVLGHDLSREKVKKTLGMDEETVCQVEKERRRSVKRHIQRKRILSANTLDKRHAVKALARLGLDVSATKAMQILGLDEELVKEAYSEEIQKREERIIRERQATTTSTMRNNKKHMQKALHIIGYDPSVDKVLDKLGVEAGSDAENEIRSAIPAKTPILYLKPTHSPWFRITSYAVVITVVAMVVAACAKRIA